ncbi:MAG: MBL fold metallo-hydrolase [Clostridia bacterium]|nr:MBL fold metallo-hydrolase [Clostridia bacterium]
MKRLVVILSLLTLLLLAGCAMGSEPAAPTDAATTAQKETGHVHVFSEKVQSDEYLSRSATCGNTPLYFFSCACGERGTAVFKGDPVPHAYAVTVTDAGVIERVRCTKEGCGHVEQPNAKLPSKGTLKGAFSCSEGDYSEIDSAKIFWYENCKETDFDDCVRELQAAGYVQKESYTMGDNRYALFSGEYCTLYLSFLSGEGAIRTYVGRSDDAVPAKTVARSSAKALPALWQIDVDCEAGKANGGMSYVLRLTDGKFIVIDGGYETDSDADSIYRILSENKPEDHKKPIVAGWFVTHMHIDHCGALRRFASTHKNDVAVEGFYYNFPYVNVGDIWPSNSRTWETLMASFEGAKLYRKLHSGMQFAFAKATVTVLCTFEDVYPLPFNSGNDTSTVFKIEIAGQSILFLGDAEYGESDRMLNLPEDALKADILQYAHHGYDKQCRGNLYEKIDPETVLWPMPFVNWESDSHGKVFQPRYEGTPSNSHRENEWIRNAASVKKIIVMAEGTTKLTLPYTPFGPRNADYGALYEAQRP